MSEQVDNDQQEQDSQEGATVADVPAAPGPAAKRLVTLAVPPIDRLLVLLGAVAMVLSGLLSWIEVGADAFPNFAGIGAGGGGVGLVVLLVGLALLSGRPALDTANGVVLGAFLASLVAVITLVDEASGVAMGAGAWVAMVGSLVALAGVSFATMDPSRRPSRRVTHKAPATLGAALAVVASFWLDWSSGFSAGRPRRRCRHRVPRADPRCADPAATARSALADGLGRHAGPDGDECPDVGHRHGGAGSR